MALQGPDAPLSIFPLCSTGAISALRPALPRRLSFQGLATFNIRTCLASLPRHNGLNARDLCAPKSRDGDKGRVTVPSRQSTGFTAKRSWALLRAPQCAAAPLTAPLTASCLAHQVHPA